MTTYICMRLQLRIKKDIHLLGVNFLKAKILGTSKLFTKFTQIGVEIIRNEAYHSRNVGREENCESCVILL